MKTPRKLLTALRLYRHYEETKLKGDFYWSFMNLSSYFLEHKEIGYLGSGAFGVVVECDNRVFKIIYREDRAYAAFVRFCKEYGECQHLPKILGEWEIRDFTVYELEPLDRFDDDNQELLLNIMQHDYLALSDELAMLLEIMQEFSETVDVCWDLYECNVMCRRNVIVITDPWC